MTGRRFVGLILTWALPSLALTAGCAPEDQRTETLDARGSSTRAQLPAAVVAALDSGSAAFREDDFETALARYERATELAPKEPAGWFGVYMAQDALGRADEAEAALKKAQGLAPGATILHPGTPDTVR